ncbi:Immunoglobulin domain protein [Aphelenchoides besseyi]|nr:Immunoglobulin domain protein [Aphelenchoides besseyi]
MFIYLLLISTLGAVESVRRSTEKIPGFREVPRNQSVVLGSDVTFRCAAESSDSEYDRLSQWRTNTRVMLGYDANAVVAMSGGRYSYGQESSEELHLHISNVSLTDDGNFECQMYRRTEGPIRSSAHLNVLVAPVETYFEHYRTSSVIEVNEDSALNVTCVGRNAKPEVSVKWYVNGKLITENIQRWVEYNSNGTSSTFAALSWRPTKKDHNKLLTCEVQHPETNTENRISLTMHVFFSSERPEIEIQNKEDIKVGVNVTLVCLVEGGNPPPRLTWHLGDRAMKTQYEYDFATQVTRNILSFVAEGSDNGAVYECWSSNRENVPPLKTNVAIKVDYPPSTVSFVNTSTSVRKGDSIKLMCRSSAASPAPVINWHINGSPTSIQPQSEIRKPHGSFTESTIDIDTNSLLSDVHQIAVDCTAINDEGSATKQQVIRIMSPPLTPFIHNYGGSPMLEGELLNLTCESHGGNPLAILSWYRGLEKLRDTHNTVDGNSSRSTVSIQLDRSMNNQAVRCESINPALDHPLNASVTLSVLFPPRIVEVRKLETDPEHMVAGTPTRLRCTVPSANPIGDIHWEFQTKDMNKPYQLPGEQIYNRTTKEFGGYEVENVVSFVPTVEMDQSVVRCIVSHPLWNNAKSKEHRLNVFYPPRIKIEGPLNIVLNEGDSFTEDIGVTANPPIINYRWRKNGIGFSDTVDAISVRGSTISGRHVSKDDSGTYLLLAANKFGSVNLTIKITVQYGARITHAPPAIFADIGEQVVLECQADGNPRRVGMVTWKKRYVKKSDYFLVSIAGGMTLETVNQDDKRAVLRINASKENSGAYVCVADNGIGRANYTTSYLLIRSKPTIQRHQGYDRAAGPLKGRARLRCVAHAVPVTAFYWSYESGTEIKHNSSKYQVIERQLDQTTFESVLYVNDLNPQDYTRKVRCRASNALGSDYAYITIGPLSAPDSPTQMSLLKYNATAAVLTWLPGFDGGSDQFYEVRYQSKEDKEPLLLNVSASEILLKDLQPSRIYYAQVRAINTHGRSSELSLPAIAIRTRAENGTEFFGSVTDNIFSSRLVTYFFIIMVVLLITNCCIFSYYYCWKKKKNQQREKTEFIRRTNYGNGRPLQLYGAIGGGLHSPATFNRRPDSNNTNKSDLLHDQLSEDDQSVRTMIQVSPNILQRQGQPTNRFRDENYIIDDSYDSNCYSVINKAASNDYPTMLHDSTINNNFAHGSPSLTYADVGGTLKRRMDSPRRLGSVTGSLTDSHRNFNTLGSTTNLPVGHRNQQPSLTTFGAPCIVGNLDGDLV